MKIKQRTKNLLIAGGIGACIMLLIASAIFYFSYSRIDARNKEKLATYELQLEEAQAILEQQQSTRKTVHVLNQDIEAGTVIQEGMLDRLDLPLYLLPENIINREEAVGKLIKIDVKKNTPLTESMVFTEGPLPQDLREGEYSFITLPSKLEKNDFVDIHIRFPSGHDYVVMSKKKVQDLVDNTVWHEINAEENLTMSSATVDAYKEGATIYALRYIDGFMQEAATVTYPVKQEVLDLILTNPNIVNVARAELEQRQRGKLEMELRNVDEQTRQNFISNQSEQQQQMQQNRNRDYSDALEQSHESHFMFPEPPNHEGDHDGGEDAAFLDDKLDIFESDWDNHVPVSP